MTLPIAQTRHKSLGRNDTCSCGSTRKYKHCHLQTDDKLINAELSRLVQIAKEKAAAEAATAEAAAAAASAKTSASGKATQAAKTGLKLKNSPAGNRAAQAAKSHGLSGRGAV